MDNPFGAAGTADYVLLTSYKKDGTPVSTPLWAALDSGTLAVWTVAGSWKVKRIRRDARVTVQPCSVSGKPKGEIVSGTARVLDAEGTARVRKAIIRKYPIQGRITVYGSLLRRGKDGTVGIEITADS